MKKVCGLILVLLACSHPPSEIAMTGGTTTTTELVISESASSYIIDIPATTTSTIRRPSNSNTNHIGAGTAAGYVGPVPCGGDLPACCVVKRESGGSWTALNPVALSGEPRGAGGAYQFIPSTWHAYGGVGYADQASPEEQVNIARIAWADWPGHWYPKCW